jgi:hypothetical protein
VIESADIVNGYVNRKISLAKAYAATKVLNDNRELTGFDGFVAIIFPGSASMTQQQGQVNRKQSHSNLMAEEVA